MVPSHTLNTGGGISGCGGGLAELYGSAVDPTLLGALIGGGAALVGGVVTGLIPYWVGRKEWVRDRTANLLEDFYATSSKYMQNYLTSKTADRRNNLDEVVHSYYVLSIYVPEEMEEVAHVLRRTIFDAQWTDVHDINLMSDKRMQIDAALRQYALEMKKSLGLSQRPIKPSFFRKVFLWKKWRKRKTISSR